MLCNTCPSNKHKCNKTKNNEEEEDNKKCLVKALDTTDIKSMLLGFKKIKNNFFQGFFKLFIPTCKVFKLAETKHALVNMYAIPFNPMITINGVPLTFKDSELFECMLDKCCDSILENSKSLYDIICETPELSIFKCVIDLIDKDTNVICLLKDIKKCHTIFAPNNQAFKSLSKHCNMSIKSILKKYDLVDLVYRHILSSVIFSCALPTKEVIKCVNLNDDNILLRKNCKGTILVKGYHSKKCTRVVEKDILATSGVIHIINRVIL